MKLLKWNVNVYGLTAYNLTHAHAPMSLSNSSWPISTYLAHPSSLSSVSAAWSALPTVLYCITVNTCIAYFVYTCSAFNFSLHMPKELFYWIQPWWILCIEQYHSFHLLCSLIYVLFLMDACIIQQ